MGNKKNDPKEDDLEYNHNSQRDNNNPTTNNDKTAERSILILLLIYIALFASMWIIPRLLIENPNSLDGLLEGLSILLMLFVGQVIVAIISLFITCQKQKQLSTVSQWMGYIPLVGVCAIVALVLIVRFMGDGADGEANPIPICNNATNTTIDCIQPAIPKNAT